MDYIFSKVSVKPYHKGQISWYKFIAHSKEELGKNKKIQVSNPFISQVLLPWTTSENFSQNYLRGSQDFMDPVTIQVLRKHPKRKEIIKKQVNIAVKC